MSVSALATCNQIVELAKSLPSDEFRMEVAKEISNLMGSAATRRQRLLPAPSVRESFPVLEKKEKAAQPRKLSRALIAGETLDCKIVNFLRDNGPATSKRIAEVSDFNLTSVKSVCNYLYKTRKITAIKQDRTGPGRRASIWSLV